MLACLPVDDIKAIRRSLKQGWKALKREQRAGAKSRNPRHIGEAADRAAEIAASIRTLAQQLAALKAEKKQDQP